MTFAALHGPHIDWGALSPEVALIGGAVLALLAGLLRGRAMRAFLVPFITVVAIGAFAGFVVATGFSQLLSALLFEVSPLDPETIAAVAVVLLLAALTASYRPVARATRIDPAIVLKSE